MTRGLATLNRWDWVRIGAALLFTASGVLHFTNPEPFERIVPEALPSPGALVAISGAAEIAGAIGLVTPWLRREAGWGLIALLVAVFPANVNMLVERERIAPTVPEWLLWARLPLQVLAVWLIFRAACRPARER